MAIITNAKTIRVVFAPDDPNAASQADASEVADVSIQSQMGSNNDGLKLPRRLSPSFRRTLFFLEVV